jgi:mannose-6-phosphate isomerase-like protein (cupin superfamily)
MKTIKKTIIYAITLIAVYLMIGYLFHLVIFPEKKPDVTTYFKRGQVYYSKAEGFAQKVAKQENGFVYCDLEVHPYAPGPPIHIHTRFDETFEISNGEMSIWVDGEIRKINPGEAVHIPKGTPHKPFNETADTIYLKKEFPLPEHFAFGLSQVYSLMDYHPDFGKMPTMVFLMAPIQQSGFDSYLYEGPPVPVQKLINFLVTPAARLMGFRSYYEEYNIDNINME